MNSSPKTPYISVFILTFSVTLFLLSIYQVIFHTYSITKQDVYDNGDASYSILSAEEFQDRKITVHIKKPAIAVNISVPEKEYSFSDFQPIFVNVSWSWEKKNEPAQKIFYPEKIEKKWPYTLVIPRWSMLRDWYHATILGTVKNTYFREKLWDFPIMIDTKRVSPRGQMVNESLTLSGHIATLPELSQVLVHELGHMIDIYLLSGRKWSHNIAQKFYKISWLDQTVIRPESSKSEFISGYAASNQYEDFAESFAMYVFHNEIFYVRAQKSPQLMKKYEFLREEVLGDYYFKSVEKHEIPSTFWDVTKLQVSEEVMRQLFV